MAYGDLRDQIILLEGNFHDVFCGLECQYLVRDLRPGIPYTFRVCCRIEGDPEWSAWSLPRVATTNLDPFCELINLCFWAVDLKKILYLH